MPDGSESGELGGAREFAFPDRPDVASVLSDDGKRTDYDNRPEAGMPTRDFVFVQPPGQDWRQIDGRTERWIATVRFPAVPGDTRVGLSPWYTYADYLRFVRTLPSHPHLRTERIGTSADGREAWELTITDPEAPASEKRTVFWHAREHAYKSLVAGPIPLFSQAFRLGGRSRRPRARFRPVP